MATDIITDNLATVGLMNDAISLHPKEGGGVLALAGSSGIPIPALKDRSFYEWLPASTFEEAAGMLSEALADASVQGLSGYNAVLEAVSGAGSSGRVLLMPAWGTWPDAVAELVPWLPGTPPDMRSRRYPVLQSLDFASTDAPEGADGNWMDQWCQDNMDLVLRSQLEDGGTMYHGWNMSLRRRVSVTAVKVDFTKPWRIIAHPDKSESVVAATPLLLEDPMFNYYMAIGQEES